MVLTVVFGMGTGVSPKRIITEDVLCVSYFVWSGDIAQLGEHLPCKQGVTSSNLVISTYRLKEVGMHLEN